MVSEGFHEVFEGALNNIRDIFESLHVEIRSATDFASPQVKLNKSIENKSYTFGFILILYDCK